MTDCVSALLMIGRQGRHLFHESLPGCPEEAQQILEMIA
jgi:hypothetical protein